LKILHFADLHIGVETYGKVDPVTGLNSRMLDILASFDYLVDYALKNEVDLVLFCGDTYKSRDPSPTQQREFAIRINRLAIAGIPVFMLVGNHDLPNAERKATSTEIFSTLAVKNVYVAARPGVYPVPTKNGVVQIAALPWVRRGAMMKQEDTKGLNLEQINLRLEQSLTGIVQSLAEKIDTSLPAILAAHLWVGLPNGKTREGTERAMTLGQEHSLLVSGVANPAFDYVALGHIHISQEMHKQPPVVYAGSLAKLDFGDEGDEKGFYEIDITQKTGETRELTYQFHPAHGRRFLTVDITLETQDLNPTDTILKALEARKAELTGAIVRLQLNIPAELNQLINDAAIRATGGDTEHFTINKNISRTARTRLGAESTEKLEPLDALNLYLQLKQTSPEHAEILTRYARELLAGEKSQ